MHDWNIYQVEMNTFQQQVGSNQYFFILIAENSCIITNPFEGGRVLYFKLFGQVFN